MSGRLVQQVAMVEPSPGLENVLNQGTMVNHPQRVVLETGMRPQLVTKVHVQLGPHGQNGHLARPLVGVALNTEPGNALNPHLMLGDNCPVMGSDLRTESATPIIVLNGLNGVLGLNVPAHVEGVPG